MQTRDVDYRCEEANLRGYLAYENTAGPRPGVLVFHEGLGLNEFAIERARRLAEGLTKPLRDDGVERREGHGNRRGDGSSIPRFSGRCTAPCPR